MTTKTRKPHSTTRTPRTAVPSCPTCNRLMYRWHGGEWVCADCTPIAPVRLDLPMSLPIRPPSARWPQHPQPAA